MSGPGRSERDPELRPGGELRAGSRERSPGASLFRWAPAVLVTGALAYGLALCSLLPLPGEPPEEGLLRLDWRLRGEETGPCLRPDEDDVAALPAHMRNVDACLGALPPYRLQVRIDGEGAVDARVRGGGARRDRPLTVYRELPLPPGRWEVEAEFFREDGEEGAVTLQLRDTVEVEAGRILLLVRRQDTGVLEIREPVR